MKKKIHSSSSSDSCSSDEEVAQLIPSSSDEPTDSDESSDQEVAEPIPSKNTKASISGRKRSIKNNADPKLAKKLKVKVEENGNPNGIMPEPLPLVDSSLMNVTTSADVKEYQNSFVFEMDLPGLKSEDINVEVEDDNVSVITGERKREEEGGGVKYLNMEQRRRFGKFAGRFLLPEDADAEAVSAACQDGVLSVTVLKKLHPPQNPNKHRRTIEVVKIA